MSVVDNAMSNVMFGGLTTSGIPCTKAELEARQNAKCYPGCKGYIKGLMAEMMPWAHTIKA